jgi:hypothetical protein
MLISYIHLISWDMKSAFYEHQHLLMLVCFLVFHLLMREHFVLLTDMVSGFISFSEAPRLAWKCGTHRSDSPVRDLLSTTPTLWRAGQT